MIEQADIDRLKDIFVTRAECNTVRVEVDEKLAKEGQRLVQIETQLAMITKLLYGIGSGIIALIVGSIWNLIAK